MPFRDSIPKLSLKFFSFKSPSTSSVVSPPSNNSPPTSSKSSSTSSTPHPPPMTPPARLYLRNVLPASPEYLPTPPPPPPTPRPWVWQCHSCLTIWRLASTRRCLLCSHEYCTANTKLTPTSGRRGSGSSGSRKSKRRRGGSGAYCRAEFDYTGWEEWAAWRRKVLGLEARSAQRARDRAFLYRAHDCFLDCDYPSQCHHERAQLAAQAALAASRSSDSSAYYSLRTVVEEEHEHERQHDLEPAAVAPIVEYQYQRSRRLTVTNPDDDLQLNEALDIAQEVEQEQERPRSPTSPKSPLSQTSFFPDGEVEAETGAAAVTAKSEQQMKLWWQPVDEYKSQVSRNSSSSGVVGAREDPTPMPLENSSYDAMKSRGGSGKLTVRNSSEPDTTTEYNTSPESSSSDDDYYDSSDDSDDYEMAESDLSSLEDPRTPEEIERDLRMLLEASKTLSRD